MSTTSSSSSAPRHALQHKDSVTSNVHRVFSAANFKLDQDMFAIRRMADQHESSPLQVGTDVDGTETSAENDCDGIASELEQLGSFQLRDELAQIENHWRESACSLSELQHDEDGSGPVDDEFENESDSVNESDPVTSTDERPVAVAFMGRENQEPSGANPADERVKQQPGVIAVGLDSKLSIFDEPVSPLRTLIASASTLSALDASTMTKNAMQDAPVSAERAGTVERNERQCTEDVPLFQQSTITDTNMLALDPWQDATEFHPLNDIVSPPSSPPLRTCVSEGDMASPHYLQEGTDSPATRCTLSHASSAVEGDRRAAGQRRVNRKSASRQSSSRNRLFDEDAPKQNSAMDLILSSAPVQTGHGGMSLALASDILASQIYAQQSLLPFWLNTHLPANSGGCGGTDQEAHKTHWLYGVPVIGSIQDGQVYLMGDLDLELNSSWLSNDDVLDDIDAV